MKGDDFHVWDGVYTRFADAPRSGPGFESSDWKRRSREVLEDKRRNPEPYRDYLLPVVAAMAGRGKACPRVIDFGGSAGFSAPSMIDGLGACDFEMHVVDNAKVCALGREVFADEPRVRFHDALPDGLGEVDLIHAGGAVQYVEDWRGLFARFVAYRAPYILLSAVPAGDIETFATVQNFYGSTIPQWFWNQQELVDAFAGHDYRLIFQGDYVLPVLGRTGDLPMENFPAERRIARPRHLLFEGGS